MSFSLYDATIPVFLQILPSISNLLEKAEAWAIEKKVSDREIIDARLAPDMLPFNYQVKSTAVHSLGAIEGVRRGEFSPDMTEPPQSFPALRERLAQTIEALSNLTAEEVNGFNGRSMTFLFRDRRMEFTSADAFLMRFSLPNFMFHATTAYDLLRMKGLDIGKRDYIGKLPLKS